MDKIYELVDILDKAYDLAIIQGNNIMISPEAYKTILRPELRRCISTWEEDKIFKGLFRCKKCYAGAPITIIKNRNELTTYCPSCGSRMLNAQNKDAKNNEQTE